jgi:hypothetical protein
MWKVLPTALGRSVQEGIREGLRHKHELSLHVNENRSKCKEEMIMG